MRARLAIYPCAGWRSGITCLGPAHSTSRLPGLFPARQFRSALSVAACSRAHPHKDLTRRSARVSHPASDFRLRCPTIRLGVPTGPASHGTLKIDVTCRCRRSHTPSASAKLPIDAAAPITAPRPAVIRTTHTISGRGPRRPDSATRIEEASEEAPRRRAHTHYGAAGTSQGPW